MSPKELKSILMTSNKNDDDRPTVSEFIDTLIAEKLQLGKKGSALSYLGLKRKLEYVFGKHLVSFEQLHYQALKKIEISHVADGGNYGGLGVYMRTIRATYNRAIKERLVSADLYPLKILLKQFLGNSYTKDSYIFPILSQNMSPE